MVEVSGINVTIAIVSGVVVCTRIFHDVPPCSVLFVVLILIQVSDQIAQDNRRKICDE
jgi:hypothetical protein